MNGVIDSINQILPHTPAGFCDPFFVGLHEPGAKAMMIRMWIKYVLCRIIHYKSKHQRILDGAATTLQLALPQEIVMNNVLSFLQLPSYSFELEEDHAVEGEEYSVEGDEDSVEVEEDSDRGEEDPVDGEVREDEEGDRVDSQPNCCCCCIQ